MCVFLKRIAKIVQTERKCKFICSFPKVELIILKNNPRGYTPRRLFRTFATNINNDNLNLKRR